MKNPVGRACRNGDRDLDCTSAHSTGTWMFSAGKPEWHGRRLTRETGALHAEPTGSRQLGADRAMQDREDAQAAVSGSPPKQAEHTKAANPMWISGSRNSRGG